jgi:hypothetical protein
VPSDKQLPGAAKYLAPKDDTRYDERNALVDRANEVTDLRVLLNDLGCDIPDGTGTSWKFRCPFGVEHEDGGMERAARYYADSNSAYCFATHGILTPVRLLSMSEGISQHKAAQRLIGGAGIKYGWRDRFREMLEGADTRRTTASPAYAVTALYVRLRAFEEYQHRQYDPDFREALEARMEALEGVAGDFDGYMAWVDGSVEVLASLLESEYTRKQMGTARPNERQHP